MTFKPSPLAFLVFLIAGWISRQQLIAIEYLKAENRLLRERLNGRSLGFSDAERALLAHSERNHQGLGNELIREPDRDGTADRPVRRRQRLGGMVSFYYGAAA